MDAVTLRDAAPGDEPALRELWRRSFGDSGAFIEDFFARFFRAEQVSVLDVGGAAVSSCFTLWGAALRVPGGGEYSCPYIYGMDTLPEYRRRGFGALLALDAMKKAASMGGDVLALLPAGERLYGWYKNALGSEPAFFAREAELAACAAGQAVEEIGAGDYNRLREEMLAGRAHVSFSPELMAFQEKLCADAGGGFFRLAAGAACVEKAEDGGLFIKELLALADGQAAAGALMRRFGASSARVRTPVFMAADTGWPVRKFTVASPLSGRPAAIPPDAYWGLAFD